MTAVPVELAQYVSRETSERLHAYVDLIAKWNPRINLVAKSQMADIWDRHIWDSAQLWPFVPPSERHVDLGSGGGLPAIVLACLAKDHAPQMTFTLIESDIRKSVFLRTVARELSLPVQVYDRRHEMVPPLNAGSVTARALASLDTLLAGIHRHMSPNAVAILPKGATWKQEVEVAQQSWHFDLVAHPSMTASEAAILEVKDIHRV